MSPYEIGEQSGSPFIQCGTCGSRSFHPQDIEQRYCGNCHKFHDRIDLGGGSYLEPDEGPRDTPFHKRIVRNQPIPHTRSGYWLELECGHLVQSFGNLAHAEGRVLCTQCRDGKKKP